MFNEIRSLMYYYSKNETGENILTIKLTTSDYTKYSHVVTTNRFISMHLGGDLRKIEKWITLSEESKSLKLNYSGNKLKLTIEEPIIMELVFEKEQISSSEELSRLVSQFSIMEQQMGTLKDRCDNMEKNLIALNEQLSYGVVLPGYAGGIIPIDETFLMLNVMNIKHHNTGDGRNQTIYFDRTTSFNMLSGFWLTYNYTESGITYNHNGHCNHFRSQEYSNTAFSGKSLRPLRYLKGLVRVIINFVNIDDYSFLNELVSLEDLIICNSNISKLNIASLDKLKNVMLMNCENLEDISELCNKSIETLRIKNCKKIKNIPSLPSTAQITRED